MREATIAAIATPPGEGGISVIRISGGKATAIARRLFRSRRGGTPGEWIPQRVYHGEVRDPANGQCLDEVLLTWFRAPKSYTGEDVVEISSHGGVLVSSKILQQALDQGARPAEPGEFTRRAFLNGKIDLSQAEAVADLIQASSDTALRSAVAQLQGRLSARLGTLYQEMLAILAQLEAAIDFPEEGIQLQDKETTLAQVHRIRKEMKRLIESYRQGKIYREGARVTLAGKPNAGKSSLLNALLQEDRAIVTPHPGTTRDLLEERVRVGDIHINIIDSAGLRHDPGHIEKEGIARTRASLDRADLALVLFDGSRSLDADDELLIREVEGKPCLYLINKCDLQEKMEVETLRGRLSPLLRLSAKTLDGMDDLLEAIRGKVLEGKRREDSVVITRERHRDRLARACESLGRAAQSLEQNRSEELVAVDVNQALEHLGALLGKTFGDDLLDEIFREFCIGK